MSQATFHIVAFDENGNRMNAARIACSTNLDLCDAIEVHEDEVRLLGDRDMVEGRTWHGLLNWRCFRIYAERYVDGVMALVLHNDGRVMLAVTATGELGRDIAATGASGTRLAGAFLYDAAKALNVEALATQMRSGMAP